MLGDPTGILVFKGLDLVTRGPVQFIARDIRVDLRRTLAVRTVGATNVLGVGHTGGTVFAAFAETATTGPVLPEGPTIPTAVIPVTVVPITVVPIAEGLAVIVTARTIAENAAVIVTARTVKVPRTTFRAVTEGLAVTVIRPALTITGRTLAATCRAVTKGTTLITVTARAVTKRLPVATKRTTLVTVTTRTITKATTLITVTTRTITKATTVIAITTRTITKATTVIAITTRTIEATLGTLSERLAVTVVRTALPIAGRTLAVGTALVIAVTVLPGAEASGVTAGIVVGAVGPSVTTIPAEVTAIAAVVLSHYGFLLLRADQWRVRSRS
ncbi:hypothetical protein ACIQTZ_16375 [Paenarthrobacter sp. NPDC090520]|uniref:hypothetical protein n=1 Tax=Paenarthrobacter sp. NPDC090520 TaxID=3364382 RepID=UPI0037F927EC